MTAWIGHRYRVLSVMGEEEPSITEGSAPGGRARAFRVLDTVEERTVALKLVSADRPQLAATLRAEFALLRGRIHPHLLRVLDFGRHREGPALACFYTAELIEGETLGAEHAEELSDFLTIARDLLDAVGFLHSLRIRHGDLKPENILMTDGRATVIDLGCARTIGDPPDADLYGTLAYMAPEILAGEAADGRADLYSLGVVLQELLPFEAPDHLHRSIDKLLHPDPSERFRTAGEALEHLGLAVGRIRISVPLDHFAGRQTERAALRAFLDEGSALALVASEGFGKTRLLQEARWDAQPRYPVHEARSDRPRAIEELVERASREASAHGPTKTERDDPVREDDSFTQVHADLAAVTRIAEALAHRQEPALLLVDDADALGEDQALLLSILARTIHRRGGSGVKLLIASREPIDFCPSVRLPPLSEDDVDEWIGRNHPQSSALYALSGGVPSTLRELLAELNEGTLSPADLYRGVDGPVGRSRISRFRRLPRSHRRTLALVSLLGAVGNAAARELSLPTPVLAVLVEWAWLRLDDGVLRLARTAEGAPILEATDDAELRWILQRWAALDHNDQCAAAIAYCQLRLEEPFDAEQTPILADPRPWRRVAKLLGEAASDSLRLLGARWLDLAGDPETAKAILAPLAARSKEAALAAAGVELRLGNTQACLALLGRDGDPAPSSAPDPSDPRAADLYARALIRQGRFAGAASVAREALDRPPPPVPSRVAAALEEDLGVAAAYLGQTGDATSAFDRADALFSSPAARERIRRRTYRGINAHLAGAIREAQAHYRAAFEDASRHGVVDQLSTLALNLGATSHLLGAFVDARERLLQGLAVAYGTEHGSALGLEIALSKLEADLGLLEAAERRCRKALGQAIEADRRAAAANARAVLGDILAAAGNSSDARRTYTEAEAALRELSLDGPACGVALQRSALEGEPPEDTLLREARSLGREAAARAALAEAEVRGPQHAGGLFDEAVREASRSEQASFLAEVHAEASLYWNRHRAAQLSREHRRKALAIWERIAAPLDAELLDAFWSIPLRRECRALAEARPQREPDERFRALHTINKKLNSRLRIDEVLGVTMQAAIDLTGAERGFVLLRDQGSELSVAVAENIDRESMNRDHFQFSRSIAEQVLTSGESVLTVDALADQRFRSHASVHAMKIRSVICAPIRSPNGILGALYLDNRFRRGRFRDEDEEILAAFADQVALALRNARLMEELEHRTRELEERSAELERERARVEELVAAQAVQIGSLETTVQRQKAVLHLRYDYSAFVVRSPAMRETLGLIDRVVDSDFSVLIEGESGSGKERVARAIHFNGPRREKPFVAINVGALPETLLESELFGHVRGAFTGADSDKAGLFVAAEDGTILLDEVGEMSPAMQVKLLRVLQEREVRPVGSATTVPVRARVLAATHRSLREEVRSGRLREDLYYRLAVVQIPIPPLRERREDLLELAEEILAELAQGSDRPTPILDRPAMDAICRHRWPGNVRELENVLRRAFVLQRGTHIRRKDLQLQPIEEAPSPEALPRSRAQYDDAEADRIRQALNRNRWNVSRVARELGIPRATLYRKLERFGLTRESSEPL
ncbi:MAG: sigma 54-interacting transcriptional regulator [Myxococcota bacterium]